MTIADAESLLSRLRDESANLYRGYNGKPTKLQAKKLAKAARWCIDRASLSPPHRRGAYQNVQYYEWTRLLLRIYDESKRLQAIGKGRR